MIRVKLVSEIYNSYVNSIRDFLIDSYNIDKEGNVLLSNKEFRDISRETAKMIIDEIPKNTLIVNDIRWEHIIENSFDIDSHIDVLRGYISKRKFYVSKYFPKDSIPEVIFDLNTADIDGELKEAIFLTKVHLV